MSKRKKKEKQQDFQKKKLRVGKTNIADNFTDTSFTAKTIVIKNQSISRDKSSEYTTSRKLTLHDLLSHLKHHNQHTRKDALIGLQELLATHPSAFHFKTGACIDALSKLFIDQEKSVRKQLLLFLSEYLPHIQESNMIPFSPVYMAYLYSSMNHILDDIRIDGFKYLNLTLSHYPSLIRTYKDKIIPSFLGVLSNYSKTMNSNKNNTSKLMSNLISNPSSELYSIQSRMEILDTFGKVLVSCQILSDNLYWYFEGFGVPTTTLLKCDSLENKIDIHGDNDTGHKTTEIQIPDSVQSFNVSLSNPKTRYLNNKINISHLLSSSGTKSTSNNALSKDSTKNGKDDWKTDSAGKDYNEFENTQMDKIMDLVIPTLVDFWIEAYPDAIGSKGTSRHANVSVLVSILKLLNYMLRSKFLSSHHSSLPFMDRNGLIPPHLLSLIEKHIFVHFPFNHESVLSKNDHALELKMDIANTLAANMIVLLAFYERRDKDDLSEKPSNNHDQTRIYEFIRHDVFQLNTPETTENQGDESKKVSNGSCNSEEGTMVNVKHIDQIMECLPVLWQVISHQNSVSLFDHLVNYYMQIPNSFSKHVLLTFIHNIQKLTNDKRYSGTFKPNTISSEFFGHLIQQIINSANVTSNFHILEVVIWLIKSSFGIKLVDSNLDELESLKKFLSEVYKKDENENNRSRHLYCLLEQLDYYGTYPPFSSN